MRNPLQRAARIERARQSKNMRAGELIPRGEIPIGISGGIPGSHPAWSSWSTERAIEEGYKASVYVYASISRIAKAAASVPWIVHERDSTGDWVENEDHPLTMLMKRPNPWMPGGDLMERITAHLFLGGNAVLTKVKGTGQNFTSELWPIRPDAVTPIPSRTEYVSEYRFVWGEIKETFSPQDILHLMFVDPASIYWGMSPLQAAARQVDTDNEAVSWNKVALQNRAVTDGVFTFQHPFPTDEQWEQAREQVAAEHMGSMNARRPWVLGAGATWQQMSLSPAEMDFIDSRKMTREEICGVFGVPPPIVGIFEHANYKVETARTIFWKDTVIPYLDDLKSGLNLSLLPEFGDPSNTELRYDTSNVDALREDFGEKTQQASRLFAMGYPANAINERLELGMEEIEGGDIGYVPSSLIPIPAESEVVEEEPTALPEGEIPAIEAPGEEEPVEEPIEAIGTFSRKSIDRKTLRWKALDRRRRPYEIALERRARELHLADARAVAEAYGRDGVRGIFTAARAREQGWVSLLTSAYATMIEEFGAAGYDEAMHEADKNRFPGLRKAWEPADRSILRWIDATVRKAARAIADTTTDIARRAASVGEDVRDALRDRAPSRAQATATVEVTTASNFGWREGWEQSGVFYEKEWLTMRDNRVREAHEECEGQTRKAGEDYDVGGERAAFPGDPRLSIGLRINCRCSEDYRAVSGETVEG